MALVDDFAEHTKLAAHRAIPSLAADFASLLAEIHEGRRDEPVILRGLAASWPALRLWVKDYFLSRYGDHPVRPTVALPAHGVPFAVRAPSPRRDMTFAAFWDQIERSDGCYMDQHPLALFPGLTDDVRLPELLGPRRPMVVNAWIGRGTKSGLHSDAADNFIAMIRGSKLAVLASSAEGARLYPFIDNTTRSQLDVEDPDYDRFPRAAEVTMWLGQIDPGDVLFIPIGWWHYLASPREDVSLSVNCWFGRHHASSLAHIVKLGPRYAGRAARDFVVHGLFRRPFTMRYYSGPPDGVQLYQMLVRLWKVATRRRPPRPRPTASP